MRDVLATIWLICVAAFVLAWCGAPIVKRQEQTRTACEARTCHTPWTKPRYENQIGCVCWERPE